MKQILEYVFDVADIEQRNWMQHYSYNQIQMLWRQKWQSREVQSKIYSHTKEQLLRIITTCLNKPLKEMLEQWLANLDTEVSSKQAAGIKAEIEAIRKQMEFDDCDESASISVSPVVSTKSVVPDDVKNYLFR